MLVILGMLLIIGLIYFPSKRVVRKEEEIGKRHLENVDKLAPAAKLIIENWVTELREEIGADKLQDKTLWRLIGLKILQAEKTDELGEDFKMLKEQVEK